jgi:hypothetical protein
MAVRGQPVEGRAGRVELPRGGGLVAGAFAWRLGLATARSAWTRRQLAAAVSIVPIVCAAGTLFVPRYSARLSTDPSSTMAATPSASMRPTTTPNDPNNFVRTERRMVQTFPCCPRVVP